MILGLDVSTSITGATVVDKGGEILFCESWDTRNKKRFPTLWDKAIFIENKLKDVKARRGYDIEKVYVEESLQTFKSGFSSAKTLSTLAKFNGIVSFTCYKVFDLYDLIEKQEFQDADVIAIDEVQFFPNLKKFVVTCLDMKKDVIIAGLDGDAFQRKWGEILDCIPIASEVTKLSALCKYCMHGNSGPFTKRIVEDKELELIGGSDMYIAVCQKHL